MMRNILRLFFLLFILCKGGVFGYAQQGADIESLAIDYYNEGQYEKSLPLFEQMLQRYPNNDLINYYLGASLVHLDRYSDKVSDSFLKAQEGDVPVDIHYLNGKNYHAIGEFDLAVQSYESYIRLAKKKDRKLTDVEDMVSLAYDQVNPFEKTIGGKSEETEVEKVVEQPKGIVLARPGEKVSFKEEGTALTEQKPESIKVKDEESVSKPEVLKEGPKKEIKTTLPKNETASTIEISGDRATVEKEVIADSEVVIDRKNTQQASSSEFEGLDKGVEITFRINTILTYTYSGQFRDEEAAKSFESGWKAKQERLLISNQADALRNQYAKENNPEKRDGIAKQILEFEQRTFPLLRKEETAFSSAQDIEERYWATKSKQDQHTFAKAIAKLEISDEVLENETVIVKIPEPTPVKEDVIDEKKAEVMEATEEVVYRIQIGAYSKTPPDYVQRQFKKLSMLRKIDKYKDDKGITVYTVGQTDNFETALTLQKQVRQEGIKDAFVAAYWAGERISLNEARDRESK